MKNIDPFQLIKKEIQQKFGYEELISSKEDNKLTLLLYKSTTRLTKISIKAYIKPQGDL